MANTQRGRAKVHNLYYTVDNVDGVGCRQPLMHNLTSVLFSLSTLFLLSTSFALTRERLRRTGKLGGDNSIKEVRDG